MNFTDKTTSELVKIRESVCSDPVNQLPPGGIWIYTPLACKKLDKIDRAITNNLRQDRLARGETIDDAGYSGQQTNKQ